MSDDTSAYTATLKAGSSYDSPWLVVRADNVEELEQLLSDVQHIATPLTRAAKTVQGTYSGKAEGDEPAAPAPAAAPASPWDEPQAQPQSNGFSPSFQSAPNPPQGGAGGPSQGTNPKDDPYYAPKPGTPYDAQPAPQGPPGDKSGIPMVWRTGSGQRGPWRAWMSAQGRDIPAHQKDSAIFYK